MRQTSVVAGIIKSQTKNNSVNSGKVDGTSWLPIFRIKSKRININVLVGDTANIFGLKKNSNCVNICYIENMLY